MTPNPLALAWRNIRPVRSTRQLLGLVGVALLLAACGASSPPETSPSPSMEAAASLPPGCANPPADIADLLDQDDPVACYGSAPLTFAAYLPTPGVASCPIVIEPAQFSCSGPIWSLQLAGETRKVGAPTLYVVVDPAASDQVAEFAGTDVLVTGHFDDPAAQDCQEVERSAAVGGTPEPAAATIELCRRQFVVTEVAPQEP
jgi:hypothetical protein